ncbi:hypothetical protein WH52_10870 [Tenacibaculum holothuriorum]|uniref:SMP-30/Gluconolactonase/LRE-like region domain-containing protein n=1 Tax=Tenacibaculum holothuriorum TaxID=1635173 RepID=A0A1Y2PAV9_9FLAO|nr:hypothetical protein WH52_10870 [Tenacibaculum holothuriorum]
MDNPESILLDSDNNVLYVSNINGEMTNKDGNGYISKLSLDGKIIKKEWITSLNAPKGLAISNNKLYVADVDEIVEIDINTSKITAKYQAPDATFLNDLVADENGDIYASNTFGFSSIYKLSNGTTELWLKNEELNLPNGLLIMHNHLFVGSWGANPNSETFATEVPGRLIKISLRTKKIKNVTEPFANLDGIVRTVHGILMSDWLSGKLLYYSNERQSVVKILDIPKGSADVEFNPKQKVVYVPQMLNGRLTAYAFSSNK